MRNLTGFLFTDLPNPVRNGHMALFEGLPTLVGGHDVEKGLTSKEVYQYHWKENKWEIREDLVLESPRSDGVMFEVPRDIFGIC